MKQTFTKLFAALALLVSLAIPMGMWGQNEVAYTFATAQSTSNTAYATNYDITVSTIQWSCPGNQNFSGYVRIGGKSLNNVDRNIYSKQKLDAQNPYNVSKITVNHKGISNSNLTVNSVKVIVASDANFSTTIETITLTPSFSASTEGSFDFVPTQTWTSEHYYKFVINVSNSKSSNYGLDLKSIVFYKDNSGQQSTTYTVTYNGNGNTSGDVPVDNAEYDDENNTVTVLGNTGNLAKTGHTFGGWCLNEEGTGTVYGPETGQTATCTISANTTFYAKWIPNTHNITMPASDSYGSYSASATENVPYGSTVALTYAPASGYSNYEPSWTVNDEPISGNTFTMPDEDVTVGVTLNDYVKDQIDYAFTETNSGSYTNWNDKTGTSGAVYAGRSAGSSSQNYLQLNYSTSSSAGAYHSGIITTGSGGKVKKVVVTWAANGGTMPDTRVLKVFGSNTAYDEPADLYDSSTQGTQLGSIAKSTGTTLNIDGDYKYVGLLTDGAAYFTKIEVYWEPSTDPSIIADDVEIAYDATSGEIEYTLTNPATNGNLTVSENVDWISNAVVNTSENKVTFSTTANEAATAREGVITLTYTYGNDGTITKDVTVTQTAAPYTTILALFEAATSTSTPVTVSFGNWVVTGVNGNQSFVTDGTNGFIMYQRNHGFEVGDILSGTVNCDLVLFNESAEITGLTISSEGLTVAKNGSVTPVVTTINTLQAVNTGSVVTLKNLTYNGQELTDENNNTIVYYTSLYNGTTLETGKKYNVTGVFVWFNSTRRILPRSADDIEQIYTKDITGYGENKYGYCLIASPIDGVNPANVAGMTDDNFDLYRFNENAELEWENWKQEGEHNHFNLERGKGYLYAHKTDVTLAFAGTPVQGTTFDVTLSKTTDAQYEGVNLVGNPFGQTAYIDRDFYVMNQEGSDFITSSGAIAPMQGIIVGAASHGETLTFTTEAPSNSGNAKVAINLSRNRGDVIDRAIVRFDEGSQLHKFQLRENSTKVYFTEGNQDFAVVRSQKAQGEMPVNFKAEENGTYTLNIDTENVEMNYLHLIDNMTGMDVDLLQTPSYTFDANTNDYASRFRLVFSTNNENGSSTGSGTFAFFSNGNWVVDNEGEATLQVIDVNGRIVSNETINGTVATSIIATPGVYMLRLVNGNEVKTQKIVVR